MAERTPYVATEWDGQQWIMFCFAYPHAMNKARSMGIDHQYLREMDEDEYPEDRRWDVMGSYVAQFHSDTAVLRVFPHVHIPPTLDGSHEDEDPGQIEGENPVDPYQFNGLPVFRVRVEEARNNDGWTAHTIVWRGDDSHSVLVAQSSEAFFAYLDIKATLDSLGVKGYMEPEFMPHGAGKGFYRMDSAQERFPLSATLGGK